MPLPAATAVVVVARFLAVLADLLLAGSRLGLGPSAPPPRIERRDRPAGDRGRPRGAARLLRDHGQDARRGGPPARRPPRSSPSCGTRSGSSRSTGCGPSTSAARPGSSPTSWRWPGPRTSGVDIDEPGLEKARARFGERVDFRLARGEDLPFDDDSVDVAVLNHIYEHVVDPEAVVADIHRVLRPGRPALPRHRPPVAGASSRTTGCRSCRGCRGAPPTATCGSPARATTTTSATTPPPGCGGSSPPTTSGTTPCPVLTDPRPSPPTTTSRPGRPRCRRPRSGPRLPLVPTYVWAAFKGSAAAPAGPPAARAAAATWPDERRWPRSRSPPSASVRTSRPVPLGAVLGIFRRGGGDPTSRRDDGGWWFAWRTPDGPVTLRLTAAHGAGSRSRPPAWGSGAAWMLERVPDLLGERDDPDGLRGRTTRQVADAWRSLPAAGGCRGRGSSCRPSCRRSSSRRSPAGGVLRATAGWCAASASRRRARARRCGLAVPPDPRGWAADPVVGVARRRRRPAAGRAPSCAPSRHAGRLEECADLARRGRPGPAAAPCPASGAGPGPRWPSGRSASPTR